MQCLEVQLATIPDGAIAARNFRVVEAATPYRSKGQVLVAPRRLGLNAGLAHRLGGKGTAYGPGIAVGDVPASDAVVEVLEADDTGFKAGDFAVGKVPWCTAAVVDAGALRAIAETALGEPASDEVLNFGGRAVICGAVSGQPGSGTPANFRNIIYRELTLRGFTVTAHENLRTEFEAQVGKWLRDRKVRSIHTIFDGIERVPEAFESLLAGGSSGRVLVSIGASESRGQHGRS